MSKRDVEAVLAWFRHQLAIRRDAPDREALNRLRGMIAVIEGELYRYQN